MQRSDGRKKGISVGRLAVAAGVSALICAAVVISILVYIFRKGECYEVTYPDYVGSYEAALSGTADLEIVKKYVSSEQYPKGVIISQYPEGLSSHRIFRGEKPTLTLSISTGRECFEMPELCGVALRRALIELGKMQCTASIVRVYDEYDEYDDQDIPDGGEVIASYPHAGESICSGERVILHVRSKRAHEDIRMPSLIGLSIADARETVAELGGVLFVNGYDVSECELQNEDGRRVIYQCPPEGAYISRGCEVDVTVNLFETINSRERGCRHWQKIRQEE